MKKLKTLLTASTLFLSTYAAQAHITEDVTHIHEGGQMRSTIQAMSPADRLNFQGEMRSSLAGMSTEQRHAFRDKTRSEQGMGQGLNQGQDSQHRYGGGSESTGQGNQFMHGSGSGGGLNSGYGRGFGKR